MEKKDQELDKIENIKNTKTVLYKQQADSV